MSILMNKADKEKYEKFQEWEAAIRKELVQKYGEDRVRAYEKKLQNTNMRISSDYNCGVLANFDPYNKKFLSPVSKFFISLGNKIYGSPKKYGIDCTPEEFYAVEFERPFINQQTLSRKAAGHPEFMTRNLFVNKMRSAACKDMAKISALLSVSLVVSFAVLFGTVGAGVKGIEGIYSGVKGFVVSKYDNYKLPEDQFLQKQITELKSQGRELEIAVQTGKMSPEDADAQMKSLEDKFNEYTDRLNKIKQEQQDKANAEQKAKDEAIAKAKAQADAEAQAKAQAEAAKLAAQPVTPVVAPTVVAPTPAPAPAPVVQQPVAQVQPAPTPVAQPAPVVEQAKPTEPPKPVKPKMSDSEKASLKTKYMSQFSNGQISKDEMLAKIKQLNNQ